MDIWVVLAIVIFVINLIAKANKQAKKQAGQRQDAPARAPRQGQQPRRTTRFEQLQQVVERLADEASGGKGNIQWKDARKALFQSLDEEPEQAGAAEDGEGKSPADGRCIGGSLSHATHEGEEFPGHRHTDGRAAAYRTAPDPMPAVTVRQRPRLDADKMRSAVVMAEVLGRPVSMRKGGAYR